MDYSQRRRSALIKGVLALASLWALTGFASYSPTPQEPAVNVASPVISQLPVEVGTTRELHEMFDRQGFAWPPRANIVPPVVARSLPADFSRLRNPELRKALFLRTLVPLVMLENHRIGQQRKRLEHMFTLPQQQWSSDDKVFANGLMLDYGVGGKLSDPAARKQLLARVDQIPAALVIGQAVLESGWGGAGRMLQRNSLFGIKRSGYDSLQASVHGYMLLLNANKPYASFRDIRSGMRSRGEELDPVKLAHGLGKYSTRGKKYVQDVIATIRRHELLQLSELELRV